MYCIVPLAGPDFVTETGGAKPFFDVGGKALIERTLGSRAWVRSGELPTSRMIFVLRETAMTGEAQARLVRLFAGAQFVTLGALSGGALLSALAGTALIAHLQEPLVVDLADLIYDADCSPSRAFAASATTTGLIPYFTSNDPAYSYIRLEGTRVLETAEKRVISDTASAGTYFFDRLATFLYAASTCVAEPERFAVRSSLFVCPVYNALIGRGDRVEGLPVYNVASHSQQFHAAVSE